VDVAYQGRDYAVDTGFIVYNDWTYPNFIGCSMKSASLAAEQDELQRPLRKERPRVQRHQHQFPVRTAPQHRAALLSAHGGRHTAFQRQGAAAAPAGRAGLTLSEYLEREAYSKYFIDHYIIPMGAAIWSSRPVDMLQFPARFFVEFFSNHGFLSVNERPTWRVISGGSREYVKRLTAPYADRIRLNTPVASLQRQANGVVLRLKNGSVENFDQVIHRLPQRSGAAAAVRPLARGARHLGRHTLSGERSTAAHRCIDHAAPAARLGSVELPPAPRAIRRVTVTYNMNILQSLDAPVQIPADV
jgi:predicted NAD/FAD-binding protein